MQWRKFLQRILEIVFPAENAGIRRISITVPIETTFSEKKKMELNLTRKWFTDKSTIGELFIDHLPEKTCYILEPTVRRNKDPRGIVAIPEGRYEITMYSSPKNKRRVPLLNAVPNHSYVEIHIGNFPHDTLDCLLPGVEMAEDCVLKSKEAFEPLCQRIDEALTLTRVFINIRNRGA